MKKLAQRRSQGKIAKIKIAKVIAILPSHTELSSDVDTMSNQKNDQGRFDIVSIGHIKTPDSCLRKVKEGN